MMRWIICCLLGVAWGVVPVGAQTGQEGNAVDGRTVPAPASDADPDARPLLLDGAFQFDVPEGWRFVTRSEDDRAIKYHAPDQASSLTISVSVQEKAVPLSAAAKRTLGLKIIEGLQRATTNLKAQVVMEPAVEPDPRLYARVRHRYRLEGDFADQLIAYRAIGRNLIMLVSNAPIESEVQAKAIHEQAIGALVSMRPAKGGSAAPRPQPASDRTAAAPTTAPSPTTAPAAQIGGISMAYSKAGVRLPAPVGWRQERSDNAEGIIVTYRNPAAGADSITVLVRPVPPEAAAEPALRQRIVEQMARGQDAQLKLEGATPQEPQNVRDPRFLRKVRTVYDMEDAQLLVESRQIVVGSTLLSVICIAEQARAEEVGTLADEIAAGAEPLLRRN